MITLQFFECTLLLTSLDLSDQVNESNFNPHKIMFSLVVLLTKCLVTHYLNKTIRISYDRCIFNLWIKRTVCSLCKYKFIHIKCQTILLKYLFYEITVVSNHDTCYHILSEVDILIQ